MAFYAPPKLRRSISRDCDGISRPKLAGITAVISSCFSKKFVQQMSKMTSQLIIVHNLILWRPLTVGARGPKILSIHPQVRRQFFQSLNVRNSDWIVPERRLHAFAWKNVIFTKSPLAPLLSTSCLQNFDWTCPNDSGTRSNRRNSDRLV